MLISSAMACTDSPCSTPRQITAPVRLDLYRLPLPTCRITIPSSSNEAAACGFTVKLRLLVLFIVFLSFLCDCDSSLPSRASQSASDLLKMHCASVEQVIGE